MDLKDNAKKLNADIPAVFLALKRKETPWYAKVTAAIVVIYAFSPIDLVPDFIPILGYLDDVIILPALIALTIKWIPQSVLEDCRAQSEGMWQTEKMVLCHSFCYVLDGSNCRDSHHDYLNYCRVTKSNLPNGRSAWLYSVWPCSTGEIKAKLQNAAWLSLFYTHISGA